MARPAGLSWFDALLGRLFDNGDELELRGALNFVGFDFSPLSDPDTGEPIGWTLTVTPTAGGTPGGAAGGDLSGTYPNPSVANINGTFVAQGPVVLGQVLRATGTSSSSFGALDLANSSAITGLLPRTNLADPGVVALTGASNTLDITHYKKVLTVSNGSGTTLTVPPNSSVAFPVGTVIEFYQYGAGQVTVAAGGGVTIRTPETLLLRKQYSSASLRKIATDEWMLAGDLQLA